MERRDFLKILMGSSLFPWASFAQDTVAEEGRKRDRNKVVILSDAHVGVSSGQWQRDGLAARVATILLMDPLPGCVLILGDLAYSHGDVADYELFKAMMEPLDKAGIPWYPMMGNHDDREAFFSVFPERKSGLVADRLVTVVKTPRSDFVLLDSLKEGKISGTLDEKQRSWLKSFLLGRRKNTFICAHHSIYDTRLQTLLEKTPCVSGYFHGHLHSWIEKRTEKGLNYISMPSSGQWGDIGYVVLTQNSLRARLVSTIVDYYYPMPKEPPKPDWLDRISQKNGREVVIPLGKV
ncbi:MAG: metallophosphoesterase [Victivallales bacterium]|nr:metallophosphoesterase [Victivallales bacterium]